MEILPLFKTHYSIGKSILTLDASDAASESGPDSIFSIIKECGLEELMLVEDNMSSSLEAYLNSEKQKVKLRYGLRIVVCNDHEEKSDDSRKTEAKYIIFAKNTDGFRDLIKLYSHAAKDGFYYYPRTDFKAMKSFWTKNLKLVIPFYDSFIFNNSLGYSDSTPELEFTEPTFLSEFNNLPFDKLVQRKLEAYAGSTYELVKAKSIYYKCFDDFKAYLSFKCISKRTDLNKPNFDHMSSNSFCFESWRAECEK